MKKLYRKSTVHPSPPPPSQQPPSTDPLAFLPAAILALAAALTAAEREVLAYLLSCSSASSPASAGIISKQGPSKKEVKGGGGGGSHPAAFTCDCFGCYMSYWARWDSSPNRQLIHEIIDAYENWAPAKNRGSSSKNRGGRRERKKKAADGCYSPGIDRVSNTGFDQSELGRPEPADHGGDCADEGDGSAGGGGEEEVGEKGPVRKLVTFIGERVWSFWG